MHSSYFLLRQVLLGVLFLGTMVLSPITQAASSTTVMAFQSAEIQKCIIPPGESTCTATIVVYGPSGMTYTVKNLTTGITSSNIITPNNFIAYNGGYAYVLKDTILGDAANRLTYGDNDITLTPPGTNVAIMKAIGTASCESGSSWNGTRCGPNIILPSEKISSCVISSSSTVDRYENGSYVLSSLLSSHQTFGWTTKNSCIIACDDALKGFPLKRMNCFWDGYVVKEYSGTDPIPTNVDFVVKNCEIDIGKNSCRTAVLVGGPTGRTYSLENITRGITSTNIITPNNYISSLGKYFLDPVKTPAIGDTANNLKYGKNYLKLKSGSSSTTNVTTYSSTIAEATCAIGSTWNGQICAVDKVICPMQARMCEDGSAMPRNPDTCEWLPGQCKPVSNLDIACAKSSFTVGEEASCKIYGGERPITCWQKGTTSTNPVDCRNVGWDLDGDILYFYKTVTSGMVGKYTIFAKDSTGKTVSTEISYNPAPTVTPTIRASNCTIAVGKSTCVSTVTMTPAPTDFYSLENTTRSITMSNAFRTGVSTISTSALGEQASNYLTNGVNVLIAKKGSIATKTEATATCATGSTWNGQICASKTTPPIACTLEVRYCDDQSIMPRDPNTCEWLPGQCPIAYPVTSIILNNVVVNNDPMEYAGDPITISSSDTLSLKGMTRPGGVLYFSREGQSTYESVGASSTTGEWELRNIWSPAGASIVIPGEYTYKITGLPPGTQSSFYSPEVLIKIKVLSSTTNTNDVLFSAKNCTIPSGKSTCASTVSVTSTKYKGTTGGRMFDMRNATRNLTTTNLFTPNNTTLNADGYPVYTVGVNSAGDAANYATYGANDFILIEGGVKIAKTTMTATCATGSSWNGKICASSIVPPTLSGGVITVSGALVARMTNCIIPEGKSTCPATVLVFAQSGKTFSVNNITRGVSSLDLIKPIHFRILQGKAVYMYRGINSPNYANNLTFGPNTLTVTEKGIANIGVTVKASASCATGKQWNGSICIAPPPTVFSAKSYTTAQGTKTLSGGSILFRPEIDKTLTLNGVGPYGAIEVLQGDGVMLRTDSIDTSGKWEFSVNPSFLAGKSSLLLTIWDGKNTSTQTRVQIYNASSTTQVSISNTTGVLTTKLVDLTQ